MGKSKKQLDAEVEYDKITSEYFKKYGHDTNDTVDIWEHSEEPKKKKHFWNI